MLPLEEDPDPEGTSKMKWAGKQSMFCPLTSASSSFVDWVFHCKILPKIFRAHILATKTCPLDVIY